MHSELPLLPSVHKPETVYHPVRVPRSIHGQFMLKARRYRSINAYMNALIKKDIEGLGDCRNCIHHQFFEALAQRIAAIDHENIGGTPAGQLELNLERTTS